MSTLISTIFIVCCLIWYTHSLNPSNQNHIVHHHGHSGSKNPDSSSVIGEYNCFDFNNVPHILDIPHPYYCHLFVKCSEHSPGSLVGTLFKCPIDQNGKQLFFSMATCYCDWEEDAVCYDSRNSTHVEEMFKCACPLRQGNDGEFSLDKTHDDRCAQ